MTSPDPSIQPPPPMPPEPRSRRPIEDGPRRGSIIVGLIILAVGVWYFADRTLGLALPDLDADQLWPIVVIAIGLWLVVRPHR